MKLVFREIPAAGADGALPEWIHVMPLGTWKGHHGMRGDLTITPAMCREVIANHAARGIDIVVDWEHQTETGAQAPAAGWIDRLELRDDGLWGHIREWTPRAAAQLRAREYRYLSPVLYFNVKDPVTGKPAGTWLASAALTNNPFFGGGLTPVINRQATPGNGVKMLLAYVLSFLGLPETTSEEEATQKLKEKNDGEASVSPEMKAKLDLGEAVIAAAGWSTVPDDAVMQAKARFGDGYMPVTEHFAALAAAERSNTAAATAATVDQLVARAIDSGKVTPAAKARFKAFAEADLQGAAAYIDAAPITVQLGAPPKRGVRGNAVTLTDEEKALAKAMRASEADVLAQKKRDLAQMEG